MLLQDLVVVFAFFEVEVLVFQGISCDVPKCFWNEKLGPTSTNHREKNMKWSNQKGT